MNKEKGWTSHDVVAKVRGILKKEAGQKIKVGHTGTLDPLATGLMIVVVGKYCKRAQEFSGLDKSYEVVSKLGFTSDTGDAAGELTKKSDHEPFIEEVENTTEQFFGVITQTPPIYSAIKVNGKRAYELARAGKEVKIESRKVKVNSILKLNYEYPNLSFECSVSSGTYIRSLVEDIGGKLGTGAFMSDLNRISVGEFKLKNAHKIDQLQDADIKELLITKL